MKWNYAIAVLLVALCGCIVGKKHVVTGANLSPEALAFLNLKDATRSEVLSTLGPPSYESTNSQVLLYFSSTATHVHGFVLVPHDYDSSDKTLKLRAAKINEDDNEQLHALFIAFDERGLVKSHAVQQIGFYNHRDWDDLCAQYAQGIAKR